MTEYKVTRAMLADALVAALQPLDYVHALWEGGAAGFDRVDQYSDLDMQMIVDDDHVEACFEVVEAELEKLGGVEVRFRLPEPTWHGHSQCFYKLNAASPYLMLDLAVMKLNTEADRFMQTSIHGQPIIKFDKVGLVKPEPVEPAAHIKKMQAAVPALKLRFELFQPLVTKEIHRGNGIEAISFYQNFTARPLLELLRIKYCPIRYFYATRYAHYDLPPEVVARLEPIFWPQNLADMDAKRAEAEAWFWQELASLDWEAVKAQL